MEREGCHSFFNATHSLPHFKAIDVPSTYHNSDIRLTLQPVQNDISTPLTLIAVHIVNRPLEHYRLYTGVLLSQKVLVLIGCVQSLLLWVASADNDFSGRGVFDIVKEAMRDDACVDILE